MKFGSGSRSTLDGGKESKNKPGPGTYTATDFYTSKQSPKFGFGSSIRNNNNSKLNVPGPGNYAAKSFTGEGQRYSMGAVITFDPSSKEQKFIPGPGNYNPKVSQSMKKEPAFKIGSEQRDDLEFRKKATF